MFDVVTNIPLFVWPLFAVLLLGGLQARKANKVPLKVLILIPAVLFGWSLFSFFGRYIGDPLAIFLWVVCLGAGFAMGFFHMRRLKLQFDKKRKMVEMPGSWIPLVLSMSIFTSKFSVGMMRSVSPHLEDSTLFLGLELFSTIILGIFAGRAAGCFFKFRASERAVF